MVGKQVESAKAHPGALMDEFSYPSHAYRANKDQNIQLFILWVLFRRRCMKTAEKEVFKVVETGRRGRSCGLAASTIYCSPHTTTEHRLPGWP